MIVQVDQHQGLSSANDTHWKPRTMSRPIGLSAGRPIRWLLGVAGHELLLTWKSLTDCKVGNSSKCSLLLCEEICDEDCGIVQPLCFLSWVLILVLKVWVLMWACLVCWGLAKLLSRPIKVWRALPEPAANCRNLTQPSFICRNWPLSTASRYNMTQLSASCCNRSQLSTDAAICPNLPQVVAPCQDSLPIAVSYRCRGRYV